MFLALLKKSPIVIGIDVGGPRKGFHAVALRDGQYFDKRAFSDAATTAVWCRQVGAQVIGIDAPCRWSLNGRSRPAERALAADKIYSFATPSLAAAGNRDFYRWMFNGAELYRLLETDYRLFDGRSVDNDPVVFETFPQAVACALAGKIVSAKHKATVRRALLREANFDTTPLTNIDTVDAALCALTARYLLDKRVKTYGEAVEGFIVVPG